jgi:hypothetical protein
MSSENPRIMHTVVTRSPWWAPWLFLLILFAAWASFQFYSTSNVAETNREARVIIREAGIQQCERVNDLRREMNRRNATLTTILDTAIESAERREDFEIALQFRDHMDELIELEMVECAEVYPEEMEQAGFMVDAWSSQAAAEQ